jgi:hypothetical protein
MKIQLEGLWSILTCKETIQLSRLQERHETMEEIQLSRLQERHETMEELNKMKRLNESGKRTYNIRHTPSVPKCLSLFSTKMN